MHLELDGRGPLHAQLTRGLKAMMFGGRIAQGARLPATRLLARELGISRNTVLAAYEQLRAEGFIDGRVGSGSYVIPPLLAQARNPAPVDAINPITRWRRACRRCAKRCAITWDAVAACMSRRTTC
jgi:GntR family transcriptional regulator/MocR family aminotransferase